MNNYYVYVAMVDGITRYIGKGKGSRYKHCNSGTSSSLELNKAFFEGKTIETIKVKENLSEHEALTVESFLISEVGIDVLYNKSKGLRGDDNLFTQWLRDIESQLSFLSNGESISMTLVKKVLSESCLSSSKRGFWFSNMYCHKVIPKYFGLSKVMDNGKHVYVREDVPNVELIKQKMKECWDKTSKILNKVEG